MTDDLARLMVAELATTVGVGLCLLVAALALHRTSEKIRSEAEA